MLSEAISVLRLGLNPIEVIRRLDVRRHRGRQPQPGERSQFRRVALVDSTTPGDEIAELFQLLQTDRRSYVVHGRPASMAGNLKLPPARINRVGQAALRHQ